MTTPQAPFTPFFTLIANPATTTHKHPTVHYVFRDDDFDPTADAAHAARGVVAVIVDIGNDGESVVAAHSLSREWQVVGVTTNAAPQWVAEDGAPQHSGAARVMLTVEGTGAQALPARTENLYELAEVFAERMALIKRVIEYGEKSSAT